MSRRNVVFVLVVALMVVSPILAGCGATATPTAVPTSVPTKAAATAAATTAATAAPTKAPATATQVPPTPKPTEPAVGGKLVFATSTDPVTLDAAIGNTSSDTAITSLLGDTLVTRDPNNNLVPGLATSWKVSPDGLTYEFALKKNVKFHDGTAMTAKDVLWTFQRIQDPATKSPQQNTLSQVVSMEAPDDYTFKLTLKAPYFSFLFQLTYQYFQPLSKAVVEKWGTEYGRHPIGVGPWKFKEWKTAVSVTVERNPDYAWGPSFCSGGPSYIQTMEMRIIPDGSTAMAGLKAGEIDVLGIGYTDLPAIQATGKFTILQYLSSGMNPILFPNTQKFPFDDVKVRQAFAYAIDKASLMKIVVPDQAEARGGPIGPTVVGYWPGIEQLAYSFDLAKAKALMKEAGWTAGSDGILVKDGKPLKFIIGMNNSDRYLKPSQVLQEQWKALGASVELRALDSATNMKEAFAGTFEMQNAGISFFEFDTMWSLFSSSQIGGFNISRVNNPDLDNLLNLTRTTADATKRQEYCSQVQKTVLEQAYVIPLYSTVNFTAMSSRIKGVIASKVVAPGYFFCNAYIVNP